jgi:PAS domain S-box-containing protein
MNNNIHTSGETKDKELGTANPLRVLLVEDSVLDAELLEIGLQRGGYSPSIKRVDNQDAFRLSLLAEQWDIIISDYYLPRFTGLKALEIYRDTGLDIPFILLSGAINEEIAIEAMVQGAQDFIMKDQMRRLIPAVDRELREARLRREKEESDARFQKLFETMAQGVVYRDGDGRIIFTNPAWENIVGQQGSRMLGRTTMDVELQPIHEDGSPFLVEEHPSLVALRTGQPVLDVVMGVYNQAQQRYRWIMVNAIPQCRPGETKPYEVHSTITDITERKRIENALYLMADTQSQLARLNELKDVYLLVGEKIYEMIGDSFVAVTVLDETIKANRIIALFGFDRYQEELAKLPVMDIAGDNYYLSDMTEQDIKIYNSGKLEWVEEGLYAILTRKVPKDLCEQVQATLGIKDVYTIGLVRNEVNFGGILVLTKSDITPFKRMIEMIIGQASISIDRIRSDQALRTSDERLYLALEAARMGIWDLDLVNDRAWRSPTYDQIFGYIEPAHEWGLKTLLAHVHPDDRRLLQHQIDHSIATGGFDTLEYRIIKPDGEVRWVASHGKVFYNEDQKPVRLLGIITDITDRKQAAEAMARQSEELERRNDELSRLYHTSESLISSTPFDLASLADTIVKTVIREFGKSNCSLYVLDKNSEALRRLAVAGQNSAHQADFRLTLDGKGLIPLALRTQQVINEPNVRSNPGYIEGWTAARSELVIPLKVGDRVIGAINLESMEPDNFTKDDERLLTLFASQAAIALENTNLVAETKLQVERLEALHNIDQTINSSLDLSVTINVLLEQIMSQLSVDAADLLLFNPYSKSLQFINGRGFKTKALQHTDLLLGDGLAGKAAVDRKIIHISGEEETREFFKSSPLLKEEGFVEYYGVPLIAKGTVKGLLEIFNRSPLLMDDSWANFMGTLAGQAAIAIDNIEMYENLQRSNNELTLAYNQNIEGWSRTLDLRDKETEGHTQRVTAITMRLGKAAGIKDEDLVFVRWGALLHDIGKMGIPDSILLKPDALSKDEWEIMRRHPVYAHELLSPISSLTKALDIPYCHHEKWDGSGYPRGLKGDQIPLAARLFAVADVWDALRSDRPYREAWSEEEAVEYIREQAGKHFDPQAVEVFFNVYLAENGEQKKPTILVVDDEEKVTRSLARSLRDQFIVLTANSGEEALEIMGRSSPVVVLTDQRMPGLTGVELMERIQTINPQTIGILFSGYTDVVALTAAINLSNVRGFISKPWDIDDLRRKLREAVRQHQNTARTSSL